MASNKFEGVPLIVARACGADSGWRVEEIKDTSGRYRDQIYDFLRFSSCALSMLCLDQNTNLKV